MDASLLLVVTIALVLLSAMTVFRLSAIGLTNRRVAAAVAELWIGAGLWLWLFTSTLSLAGHSAASPRSASWLSDLVALLRSMSFGERLMALAKLSAAAALVAHFMWSVSRLRPHQAGC
jgi:hypothetical protein